MQQPLDGEPAWAGQGSMFWPMLGEGEEAHGTDDLEVRVVAARPTRDQRQAGACLRRLLHAHCLPAALNASPRIALAELAGDGTTGGARHGA